MEEPGQAGAQAEHNAIVEEVKRMDHDWVDLERRILAFKKARLFRQITDPVTGKLFTRFDSWVRFVAGQCPATFFANQRILRELAGVVPDEDLKRMPRQNAKHLVNHKKAGKKVDADLIRDAVKIPAVEFEAKHPVEAPSSFAADQIAVPASMMQVGPFSMTRKAAKVFRQALTKARKSVGQIAPQLRESAALEAMARGFLSHCATSEAGDIHPAPQQPENGDASLVM